MQTEQKGINQETINRMELYRRILLQNGFSEPICQKERSLHWMFYKETTGNSAFVVNLTGYNDRVEVVYGFASTAFTFVKGDEESLVRWGIADEDINLRQKSSIFHHAEERDTGILVKEMYDRYKNLEKEALLRIVRIKRKKWIDKIAEKLKPLGFKKKANTWKRVLEDGYYLMFHAQKSSFSDEYYFNVYIGKENTDFYGDCYYNRIVTDCPLDWQTIADDEMIKFLENDIVSQLMHIIETPLHELGKETMIGEHCECDRQQCVACWIQKKS